MSSFSSSPKEPGNSTGRETAHQYDHCIFTQGEPNMASRGTLSKEEILWQGNLALVTASKPSFAWFRQDKDMDYTLAPYYWRVIQMGKYVELRYYRSLSKKLPIVGKFPVVWCTTDITVPRKADELVENAKERILGLQTDDGMKYVCASNLEQRTELNNVISIAVGKLPTHEYAEPDEFAVGDTGLPQTQSATSSGDYSRPRLPSPRAKKSNRSQRSGSKKTKESRQYNEPWVLLEYMPLPPSATGGLKTEETASTSYSTLFRNDQIEKTQIAVEVQKKSLCEPVFGLSNVLGQISIVRFDPTAFPEPGLHLGDVVLTVDKCDISTYESFHDAVAKCTQDQVTIEVMRNQSCVMSHIILKQGDDVSSLGLHFDNRERGFEVTRISEAGLVRRSGKPYQLTARKLNDANLEVNWALVEINGKPVDLNVSPEGMNVLLESAGQDLDLMFLPVDLAEMLFNAEESTTVHEKQDN